MTQGPNSPRTTSDDATVGTITWSTTDNAKASDAVYATATVDSGTTHYLKVTDFGFSIPLGAVINGLTVEVQHRRNGTGTVKDSSVVIVKSSGAFGSTNKADTVNDWTATENYATYGSSADLWGEAWSAADLNSTAFGVAVSAILQSSPAPTMAQIDHVRITIDYTAGIAVGNALLLTI